MDANQTFTLFFVILLVVMVVAILWASRELDEWPRKQKWKRKYRGRQ